MQYAKGFIGTRWAASDPNSDPLLFTVEIRGVGENEWKLLKDKVTEALSVLGSHGLSGWRVSGPVTASDSPGIRRREALTARLEGQLRTGIDNTPPKVSALAATRARRQVTSEVARSGRAQ